MLVGTWEINKMLPSEKSSKYWYQKGFGMLQCILYKYYNYIPVRMQMDSSRSKIGAVHIQDGNLDAYASKSQQLNKYMQLLNKKC